MPQPGPGWPVLRVPDGSDLLRLWHQLRQPHGPDL
nr:MAG TPA: hypothetical protein [Caudoviricetes sp.]DAK57065.1 MAG TPA: hypothetical protein [Caudoviricetes sp.]